MRPARRRRGPTLLPPERAVVPLVLVGVRLGKRGHGAVEGLALAEIRGDRDPVARARVGSRERPAADLGVGLQLGGIHQLDVHGALGVPQLPDVEVARLAVDCLDSLPAEQDVGRRLHHPLPFHDAPSVLDEPALPEERLEHRGLRFLELKEQRVVLVAAQQQQDPGAGAHAADTDDLPGGMHVSVAVEQVPTVAGERARICADHAPHDVLEVVLLGIREHVLDRRDEGMTADDPQLAVDVLTEL